MISFLHLFLDTMAAVASALTAGLLGVFTLSAAATVKATFDTSKEAIEAIPIDEEVRAADEVKEKENDAYNKAVVWSAVPLWAKSSLLLAVGSMIACCAMLVGFSTSCFADYDLMFTSESTKVRGSRYTKFSFS